MAYLHHFLWSLLLIQSFALLIATEANAFRIDNLQQPLHFPQSASRKHVAIIGAGSAGASAAYYLDRLAQEAAISINITVYERAHYIGGRSTTINVHDDPTLPVELGASIFVAVNRNLVAATKEFNLSVSSISASRQRSGDKDVPEILGVWNGERFVTTQALGGGRWQSWWSNAKLLYRYGFAPLRTLNLMKSVVGRFLELYDPPYFPFADLSQAAYDVRLTAVTAATGEQYLRENNVGDSFATEIVQASTRVNYAQNLAQIHGLDTMVCMATDGAMSVEDGNWRIFDGMITAAGARVLLNTSVDEVKRLENGRYILTTTSIPSAAAPPSSLEHVLSNEPAVETKQTAHYDDIILAAPYHQSAIAFIPPLDHIPDNIPYVRLHVTLFSTPHLLSPSFFNMPPTSHVPTVVLTTLHPSDVPTDADADTYTSSGPVAGRAGFFSISLVRTIEATGENVYKIFSPQPIRASFLRTLLGLPPHETQDDDDDDDDNGRDDNGRDDNGRDDNGRDDNGRDDNGRDDNGRDVTWIYRKEWLSYPYLPPRVTFDSIQVGDRVWYTGGVEAFISTMETSSLMGMNVAKLVVERWMGDDDGDGGGNGDVDGLSNG